MGQRSLSTREALIFIEQFSGRTDDYWGFIREGDKLTIYRPPLKPIQAFYRENAIIIPSVEPTRLLEWLPADLAAQFVAHSEEITVDTPEKTVTLKEFLQ